MAERQIGQRKWSLVLSARFPVVKWRSRSVAKSAYYPLNESFGLLQIHIQDFASALLENFDCKVGVITSLLTLSQAFDNYVHFNKRYSSKSLKDTENYN